MKRGVGLRPRKKADLPPEKLYVILRQIYPKDIADEKYTELTGLKPPQLDQKGGAKG